MLSLLSEVAGERPLICLVDDEQWLDHASAQALGFVARRLAADPMGMVFAARVPGAELAGLPELVVEGLRGELPTAAGCPADPDPAAAAGGGGRSVRRSGAGARAAGRLGIPVQAAAPAVEAGLVVFGTQVRFRHPLLRTAAYRSVSVQDRREVHGVLAEVTDPAADPDRRAWHRAKAAAGPDEEVAAELERSAGRARARGGLAAAAAFLERAVLLTVDPARHAERTLAAAQASLQVGAFSNALELLATAEAGPLDDLQSARADLLRGQIVFTSGLGSDAPPLLLKAATWSTANGCAARTAARTPGPSCGPPTTCCAR